MAEVTLSSKGQVTIPAEMVRNLGLKAGDKLVVELVDDHLVLLPRPASWADYFTGRLKGVYGSTKEEIDRYIAEERASWGRGREDEALDDALAVDPALRKVYRALPEDWQSGLGYSEIHRSAGVADGLVDQKLDQLVRLGAVKKVPLPNPPVIGDQVAYRRVRR